MKQDRMARINRLLQTTLADMVPSLVKDPRIKEPALVSVVEVKTTPDLRFAKVFVSIFGEASRQEAALNALKQARGFLRGELGHRVHLRYTPELHFALDTRLESASRIDQILQEVAGGGGDEES